MHNKLNSPSYQIVKIFESTHHSPYWNFYSGLPAVQLGVLYKNDRASTIPIAMKNQYLRFKICVILLRKGNNIVI